MIYNDIYDKCKYIKIYFLCPIYLEVWDVQNPMTIFWSETKIDRPELFFVAAPK